MQDDPCLSSMKMSVLDSKCCRFGFSSILGILGLRMKTRKQLLGLSQLFDAVHISVQYISTVIPKPNLLSAFMYASQPMSPLVFRVQHFL